MITIGRGSVVVENPPPALMDGLRNFNHKTRSYEDMFILNKDNNILVTAPGFADLVTKICKWDKVRDVRVPMPTPQITPIGKGDFWDGIVGGAILAGGGVITVPDFIGSEYIASKIIGSFQRDALAERGTPITIVAERDRNEAKRISARLSELLPGREVGVAYKGSYTESDDVIVTTYEALDDSPLSVTGVFIGDDLASGYFSERAEKISMLRNAARWGIRRTAFGGGAIDMAVEGLFGQISASVTHDYAVKVGYAAPVTVCWLPCPAPPYAGRADPKLIEAIVLQGKGFCDVVSEVVRSVPSDMGCVVWAENTATAMKVAASMPGILQIHGRVPKKERNRSVMDLEYGVVRKAVVSYDSLETSTSHSVYVMATCGGKDAASRRIPRGGKRAYVVDFTHDWDVHNGRPGRLRLNDEARNVRYKEMGFSQIRLEDASQLPFV